MAQKTDIIKTIDSKVRSLEGTSTVINLASLHALGYALPIGVPMKIKPTVKGSDNADIEASGLGIDLKQAPLTLRREDGTAYVFPLDPIMSVNSKNIITRRYVAKINQRNSQSPIRRGTVKEYWSQDDYDITISGMITGGNADELNQMVREFTELCESGESLAVECDWLTDSFGITRLVVESFQFPHTKGVENQSYMLKCYSDDSVNILEEIQ